MNAKQFEELYHELVQINPHYETIIINYMRVMDRDPRKGVKPEFGKHFQHYKKQFGISYKEMSEMLCEKGFKVGIDTLKSYSRKNRPNMNSIYIKEIAEILGVPEDLLLFGNEKIVIMAQNSMDVRKLYESLTEQNQLALTYLLNMLIVEKTTPEAFEEDIPWEAL